MHRQRFTSTVPITFVLVASLIAILAGSLAAPRATVAQSPPAASTIYRLALLSGPGPRFEPVAVLEPGTTLVLEARTSGATWVLGRSDDGSQRGWASSLYLRFGDDGDVMSLPVSSERVPALAAPPGDLSGVPAMLPEPTIAGELGQAPVVPLIHPRIRGIFARGQELGNNPRVFIQVGECNTMDRAFMIPFGTGTYNLGSYGHLQAAVRYFQDPPAEGVDNSFWYKGITMETGFTCAMAVDPIWSEPQGCAAGQSLLACEYERVRPSIALIHLGIYDVYWLTPEQYEDSMRAVIDTSIEYGVIPVLTTFPTCAGDTSNWPNDAATRNENRLAFNVILLELASEYGVPLINLWRATQALPDCGMVAGDYQHLSLGDPNTWASFTGDEQVYGFTMWNLVALTALDQIRLHVLEY